MDRQTFELLESSVQEAEDLWRAGQSRLALLRYCSIFEQRWSQVDKATEALTAADLTILERMADLSVPFGLARYADALLALAADGYRRLHCDYWHDLITLKRIHLCFGQHDPLRARLLFRDLHAPFSNVESASPGTPFFQQLESSYTHDANDEPRHIMFQNFYLQLGRLLLYLGRYEAAILVLRRGRQWVVPDAEPPEHAADLHFRLELARALLERGDLAEAQDSLAEIWPSIDHVRQPAHTTAWLALSARMDLLRGNFGSAKERLTEICSVCAANGFFLPALRSLLSVAGVLILLNQTIEARQLLLLVMNEARRWNDTALQQEATRLSQVAEARVGLTAEVAASVGEMQAGVAVNRAPNARHQDFPLASQGRALADFESRTLQFQFYLGAGKMAAAQSCIERLQSFSHSDSALIRIRFQVLQAMFDYYTGDPQRAAGALREALPVLRDLGLIPELWRTQVLYRKSLEKLNVTGDEVTAIEVENYRLLETLADSLSLYDRIVFLLNKPTFEEEEIGGAVRALQAAEAESAVGWISRMWRAYKTQLLVSNLLDLVYRQRYAFAISRLMEGHPQQTWPRTSIWKRMFLRSPQHALVSFVVLPDATVAISQTWGRLRFQVSSTTRLRLRGLVAAWHETIPESRPDEAARLAATIAKEIRIKECIADLPSRVTRLTILPDDVLHGFPFSVVQLDDDRLFERFSLTIGFAPTSPSSPAWRRPPIRNALLAGVTSGTPPLKKTAEQLQFVQSWLADHRVHGSTLLDDNVTPEELSKQMQATSLLHVSCHGEFSPDDPENTGWQLLSGDGQAQIFGLAKMFQLDLRQLQHATLLSCWGADNFVLPGRWILSLPEVLWRAGTGSIVACLWEISEDSALEFVRHFYAALAGRRTDEAVREAQRRLMRSPSGREREPVDWAGFQHYGTPHKLKL